MVIKNLVKCERMKAYIKQSFDFWKGLCICNVYDKNHSICSWVIGFPGGPKFSALKKEDFTFAHYSWVKLNKRNCGNCASKYDIRLNIISYI